MGEPPRQRRRISSSGTGASACHVEQAGLVDKFSSVSSEDLFGDCEPFVERGLGIGSDGSFCSDALSYDGETFSEQGDWLLGEGFYADCEPSLAKIEALEAGIVDRILDSIAGMSEQRQQVIDDWFAAVAKHLQRPGSWDRKSLLDLLHDEDPDGLDLYMTLFDHVDANALLELPESVASGSICAAEAPFELLKRDWDSHVADDSQLEASLKAYLVSINPNDADKWIKAATARSICQRFCEFSKTPYGDVCSEGKLMPAVMKILTRFAEAVAEDSKHRNRPPPPTYTPGHGPVEQRRRLEELAQRRHEACAVCERGDPTDVRGGCPYCGALASDRAAVREQPSTRQGVLERLDREDEERWGGASPPRGLSCVPCDVVAAAGHPGSNPLGDAGAPSRRFGPELSGSPVASEDSLEADLFGESDAEGVLEAELFGD